MNALETVGIASAKLSAASVAMKRRLEHVRWAVLGLAVTAALLGAIMVTVIPPTGPLRWTFAAATALVLGLGPWLSGRFLGQKQATRWVEVRAAAEALKREVYKRATKCKPYDGAPQEADDALIAEKAAIETNLGDVEEVGSESMNLPKAEIDLDSYLQMRVQDQINWMRKRAGDHSRTARRLRWAEGLVALVGIVLSALGAALGETIASTYLAPFIGVVTTFSTAVIAHIEAGRYDFVAATYRITAKSLENEVARRGAKSLQEFVEKCEAIFATESNAWMAKFLGQQ